VSQENVELAKAGLAALQETYQTGDIAAWGAAVQAYFDPDIVLETGGADAFTEGSWHGRDGAIEFVANQMEVLEGMWITADEFIEASDDRLIVRISFGGRARHTGLEVRLSPTHVFDLREGSVVRWRIFQSREAALEATGLSEELG
jgi:ketosteroid isomerase-like protein